MRTLNELSDGGSFVYPCRVAFFHHDSFGPVVAKYALLRILKQAIRLSAFRRDGRLRGRAGRVLLRLGTAQW